MVDINKLRNKEIKKTATFSNTIRKRLEDLKIPLSKKTKEISTDLGDIHEVCNQYTQAIELLLSDETLNDNKLVIELLKNIRSDLYIHLAHHLKELKKPLDALIEDLENV